LLPHGSMTLDPTKKGLPESAIDLHKACKEAGRKIRDSKPDLIVLCTPHGVSLSKSLGVYVASSASGTAQWNDEWKDFEVSLKLNTSLAFSLLDHLNKNDAPAEGITFFSALPAPLKWGEVVPSYFITKDLYHQGDESNPEFVIITPPRGAGSTVEARRDHKTGLYPELMRIGELLREWTESIGKRAWLVVSGDLSHYHPYDESVSPIYKPAPNWFDWAPSETAEDFDAEMEKWVGTLSGKELLEVAGPKDVIAASCGFSGCVILQGALQKEDKKEWKSTVLTRQHPTYFGMMVALWTRD